MVKNYIIVAVEDDLADCTIISRCEKAHVKTIYEITKEQNPKFTLKVYREVVL